MRTFKINGSLRTESGKKAAKAIRKEGLVPCVLYGGEENVHFTLSQQNLHHLLYTDKVYIIELEIDGKIYASVLKEIQFHPVSDVVIHIDFLLVKDDKPLSIEIPVKLKGTSEGVKAGGKLQLQMRYLKVKGLRANLPDELEVNISNLVLGKTIQVSDLNFENLELLNAKNSVVVSVKLTRAARGAAAAEAEAGK